MADSSLRFTRRQALIGAGAGLALSTLPFKVNAGKPRATRRVVRSIRRTKKLLPLLLPNDPKQRKAARKFLKKSAPFKVHGLDKVLCPSGLKYNRSERHVNVMLERCGEIQALYLKYAKRLPTNPELSGNLSWLCNKTTKQVAYSPITSAGAFAQDSCCIGMESPEANALVGALGLAMATALSIEGIAVSIEGGAAMVGVGGALISEGLAAGTLTAEASLVGVGMAVSLSGLSVIALGFVAIYLFWEYVIPELMPLVPAARVDDPPEAQPPTEEPAQPPTEEPAQEPTNTPPEGARLELTIEVAPEKSEPQAQEPPDDDPGPEGEEGDDDDGGEDGNGTATGDDGSASSGTGGTGGNGEGGAASGGGGSEGDGGGSGGAGGGDGGGDGGGGGGGDE